MARESRSEFTAIDSRFTPFRIKTSGVGFVVAFVLVATLVSSASEAADTVWYQTCWTGGYANGGPIEPILPTATAVLEHMVQLRGHMLEPCVVREHAQLQYYDSPIRWRISSRNPELIPGNFPVSFLRIYAYYTPDGEVCPPCGGTACNVVAYMLMETPYTPADIKARCGNTGNSYTIKLSANGDLAADGNLSAIEPGKTGTLKAVVYDQQNNSVSGVAIRIVVDVNNRSGGHNHDDPSRHSVHMGKLTPAGASQGAVEQGGKVLTGSTGAEGFEFTFTAPAISGDHKITVTCTDGRTCTQEGPDGVWVGVKGLQPIGDGPWELTGKASQHPNNHYLTVPAFLVLQQLALDWRRLYVPFGPVFAVNDASLERGGLFDIFYNYTDAAGIVHERNAEGWWIPPHTEHRRGTVVDIRANGGSYSIRAEDFADFRRHAQSLGADARIHSPGTPNQHFHMRLMRTAE